mmetsp:Transcript_9587/g.22024  ORF Transcript_9587/g.22024 Transcript_9587/m.22024 type:complete len:260 (-) Transcript_9587:87-866(-)
MAKLIIESWKGRIEGTTPRLNFTATPTDDDGNLGWPLSELDGESHEGVRVHVPGESKPCRPEKLLIFDLDNTLVHGGHRLLHETKLCLQREFDQGTRLAVATFNRSAVAILMRHGLLNLFDIVVMQRCTLPSKKECLDSIFDFYSWNPNEEDFLGSSRVCFFDDCPANLDDVRGSFPQVICVHVQTPEVLADLVACSNFAGLTISCEAETPTAPQRCVSVPVQVPNPRTPATPTTAPFLTLSVPRISSLQARRGLRLSL